MKQFEIVLPYGQKLDEEFVRKQAAQAMGVPMAKVGEVEVLRRSLDARSKNVLYRYRVEACLVDEHLPERISYRQPRNVSAGTPVLVAGAGPAGMFAALKLITRGLKPIILERGKDVHKRKYDIAAISRSGSLNEDSNYCFGEGGAGTFSDGKLYTRSNKKGDVGAVLRTFVDFGADPTVMLDAHGHIGSDKLPGIVEAIRNYIIDCGGEYHFDTRITSMVRKGSNWQVEAGGVQYEAPYLILATGHSATDIYRMFLDNKWLVEPKGFALGVRVEHPQALIDRIQYHGREHRGNLPAAEYSLVEQVDGRGVFSFCMCPGGILVPSSTEDRTVVTNGMSNSARNSRWANSGIVTSVEQTDVEAFFAACDDRRLRGLKGPEAMLEFRRMVEARCFEVSSSFAAPAQTMTDFVRTSKKRSTTGALPKTSYAPGAVSADLCDVLPDFVAGRLKKAFLLFDKKMKGFYTSEALLLAVESRTSSPVRIPRDPATMQHPQLEGLYPCGEGAGYAGGIVSSALDGINAATLIPSNATRGC